MMQVKMKDIYGTQVSIQESGSGYFRLDFEGKDFPKDDDGLGNKIEKCFTCRSRKYFNEEN